MALSDFDVVAHLKKLISNSTSLLGKVFIVVAIVRFVYWFFTDYLAYLVLWIFEQIEAQMQGLSADINLGQAGLNWAMVNSWVPVPEIINFIILFFNLVVSLLVIRWVRNLVPFLS